jgi:hypothetical protein
VSDFDSLREDIAQIGKSIRHHADAQGRANAALAVEIDKLWDDNAAIRDDLHAVANRLEALTAFVTSNPAEVAAKIVNDANRGTLREVRDDG